MDCEDICIAIEFLISLGPKAELLLFDDFDEWLNDIMYKVQVDLALKRIEYDFTDHRFSINDEMSYFKEFFKSTISYPVPKARLEMLMGTNIVRLTDRKYMMKLMAKLRDNHEKQQQKRIEEREKQELIRTKNMILHRFIPVQEAPIEIRQYPLFKLYLYCDALVEKNRKARAPKKVKMSRLLYKSLYPEKKQEIKAEKDENVYLKKIYDGETEKLIPLSKEETEKYIAEQSAIKDLEDGYMMSQEDYDRLHYEAEGVKHLRNAQTVDELYKRAYEIIGLLYTHVEKDKKNKSEKTEKTDDEDNDESLNDET